MTENFNEALNDLTESQFEILVARSKKFVHDEYEVEVVKPCRMLCFCPFGPLVEDMPIYETKRPSSCAVFGHECPAFVYSEPFIDFDEEDEEED